MSSKVELNAAQADGAPLAAQLVAASYDRCADVARPPRSATGIHANVAAAPPAPIPHNVLAPNVALHCGAMAR